MTDEKDDRWSKQSSNDVRRRENLTDVVEGCGLIIGLVVLVILSFLGRGVP